MRGQEGEKEGRVNEVTDHCALHDSSQNWSDGDATEISMLLRKKDCGDRLDASLFPLLWDSGDGYGKVEELSYGFAESWCSQPEEPGRNTIKTVEWSLSRILKTDQSKMYSGLIGLAGRLRGGGV